jgi:hypothetical protein
MQRKGVVGQPAARDQLAIDAARAVLDPTITPDARLLDAESGAVLAAQIEVVRRAPTLAGIDTLVDKVDNTPRSASWSLVWAMNEIAGMPVAVLGAPGGWDRHRLIDDYWKQRRRSWKPPAARAAPRR